MRPLHSNGIPLLLRIRWNLFISRFLAMSMARTHRKHLLQHLFYCCVRVLRALSINGYNNHISNILLSHAIVNS
jgi:hypothetical protein